jgi:hypothetical protein
MASNAKNEALANLLSKSCPNLDGEVVDQWLRNPKLLRYFLQGALEYLPRNAISEFFPCYEIEVDYDKPLDKAVEDGHFDYVGQFFTSKNLPSTENGKKKKWIYLFEYDFDERLSFRDVIKEITSQGFRGATPKEILALGTEYPGLQLTSMIFGLGQMYQWDNDGFEEYSVLCSRGLHPNQERMIDLRWSIEEDKKDYKVVFAVVRKES